MINQIEKLDESICEYLKYLFEDTDFEYVKDFLTHSEIFYEKDPFYISRDLLSISILKGGIKLTIISNPEAYKLYYDKFEKIKQLLIKRMPEISGYDVTHVHIKPDINKFKYIENKYTPIITPWDEINEMQTVLFKQLKSAVLPIDYQNIGNTCRTIMQKISNHVFDPLIYTDTDGKDVSEGCYKNRLHTVIKTELGGSDNKPIRAFSLAIIDSAEKAINLANDLTHSLNADPFIAESCVIGTISVINIIKIVTRRLK